MSTNQPKKKEKRPHSSTIETKSFVKNVTSVVSGLLPATITKWFSSSPSSSANGSTAAADATDSSTEDEAPESPSIAQPPPKRMRYNTSGQNENYSISDVNCPVSTIPTPEPPYIQYSATPYPIRSTLASSSSSHTTGEETVKESAERETTVFKPQHTVSSIGHSVAGKRKSIFDIYSKEDSKRACGKTSSNAFRNPKQTCFKPSLLGSPFYPGLTMYGGAASSYVNQPNIKEQKVAVVKESTNDNDSGMSSSARRIMELLEQYSSPLREAKRIPLYTRPTNNSLNASTERQTTVRSSPYSYKTQELHTPSIASILQLKKKSRLMDTTNAARQIIASHSSTIDYPPYPTSVQKNELEKDQDTKMTTKVKSRLTRTNRGNQEDLDIATPVRLPTATLSINLDNLPKFNFGTPSALIPIIATSTPKSIFNTPETKKSTEVFTSKPDTTNFKFSNPIRVSYDTQEKDTAPPNFKFHSPERGIEQRTDGKTDGFSVVVGNAKTETTSKSDKWKCSDCWVENKANEDKCVCCGAKSPLPIQSAAKCSKCKINASQQFKDTCVNCDKIQNQSSPSSSGAQSRAQSEWKCSDCWAPNKPESLTCVCCGGKPPSKSVEKTKCSVCKLADSLPLKKTCANCDKIQLNNVGVTGKPNDGSKWKCDGCWVNNDNYSQTCISCGVAKHEKPEVVSKPSTNSVESDWKCDDCWISNKSTVDKCAACGGSKPSAKPTTATSAGSPFYKSPDNSLKNIAKSQKLEKWECSSCLVRNDSNKSLCVCCGAERENKNKMLEKKFNFGSNTSFKFGIDPKVHEATFAKKPETESETVTKLKEQSEKNNNVLVETPNTPFTFTSPTKKAEDDPALAKPKVDEAPKMTFTFGIPKTTPTSVPLGPPKKDEEKEKPQEVPKVINFGLPTSEAKPKTLGNMFSSSTPSLPTSHTTALSNESVPPKAEEKKQLDISSTLVTLGAQPVELNTTSTVKPATALGGFTFGGSLNPPTNIFGAPATTAMATIPFTIPAQSTTTSASVAFKPPETSTVNSMLQRPNSQASTNASLFQLETSTTGVTTAASTGPVFSFGSNGSNPKPALSTDKPALTFTFGSNAPNSDVTPFGSTVAPFKSIFGSGGDNNAAKTISLPSGHSLGSESTLAPNPIGGLSSTNGLLGSTMSTGTGNTMGGTNGIPSNPLGAGNSIQAGNVLSTGGSSGLFSTGQKDNMWSSSNNQSTNLFASNTTTSTPQKPAAFTFGTPTPFNVGTPSAFGGSVPQPTQNIFGLNQSNNNQPTLFASPAQSQPAPNIFGVAQPATQSTLQMGMFGSPNVPSASTFGSPNPSLPTFENPAAPAPAFNFGAAQQSTNIFGFGMQQQPQQPAPQQGVYSFGGAPAGGAVQFNIGSGPNTAMRRMRKAVRRNPPR